MSELNNNKAGLQKKVSSVFKGVPVPQNNTVQQPSGTPAPNPASDVSPKPASVNKQFPQSSLLKKLSQAEDSPDIVEQSQKDNNVIQKPKSPPINKIPQPQKLLEPAETTTPLESSPVIEETGNGLLQQIKSKLFTPKPGVSPARQTAMVIMVPILAIVMIFVIRQILSKSPHKTKGADTDDIPIVTANADPGDGIDWKIPEPITIVTKDPVKYPDQNDTQPNQQQNQSTGGNKTETINIRDIIFSKDKPSALVGSKIVYVGDTINGMTITKINRDSIEFERDGQRWEQNVRDGKQTPLSENPDR